MHVTKMGLAKSYGFLFRLTRVSLPKLVVTQRLKEL
jgi:hypothetical protein